MVKKGQFRVVIRVVKKGQFWVLIRVVKKGQFWFGWLLGWLKRGSLGGY